MNKKVVIIPIFCEAHMVKYQIPNIIDTIEPDYIIYNEGMFPTGPENTTNVNEEFLREYTIDSKRGFDFEELQEIIYEAQREYKDTNIILNKMNYPDNMVYAPDCYVTACSNFKDVGIEIEEGDYIFPFEGDVFHHEDSKEEIQGYLKQLKPNTGFKSIWVDFVENQFYAFKSTLKPFLKKEWDIQQGRSRRIGIKFGDWDWYKYVINNFMTQQYPMLYPTDLITYHYAWWRPGKYKDLRYKQLNRSSEYWTQFQVGLDNIRENKYLDIDVRPSMEKNSTYRYIRFFDIDHPSHVKDHPCYDKELTEDQRDMILKNKLVFEQ